MVGGLGGGVGGGLVGRMQLGKIIIGGKQSCTKGAVREALSAAGALSLNRGGGRAEGGEGKTS